MAITATALPHSADPESLHEAPASDNGDTAYPAFTLPMKMNGKGSTEENRKTYRNI